MAKVYSEAEAVEALAEQLIGLFHPHLAEARIKYVFVDKASTEDGRKVYGKAKKMGEDMKFLTDLDFLITIGLDAYNELDEEQRTAAVDHLLERCAGEEDEKTGEMSYFLRKPDVQEFTSILRRRGAWQEGLNEFVSVAKALDIDQIAETATGQVAQTTDVLCGISATAPFGLPTSWGRRGR